MNDTPASAALTAQTTPQAAEDAADPMYEQVNHWFTYQTPSQADVLNMGAIREQARQLARTIVRSCPPSADRSAAIRHLREAVMTANASIVLGGK